MTEAEVLSQTRQPNTEESLLRDLRALGVRRGDTLVVHSAMHELGWVCGRELAVVHALLHAVGPWGTLIMPTHTGDNSEPSDWQLPPVPAEWCPVIREQMPAFDRNWPTRGMGRVVECFRRMRGVCRSAHPQLSWCAKGPFARWLLRGHVFGKPGFGPQSPVGRFYRRGAKILLLGVGYGNCTCLHLAESLNPATPKLRVGAAMRVHGVRRWMTYEEIDKNSDRFPELGAAYEAQGGPVQIGRIGQAESRLLPIRPLVDFGLEWLKAHPETAEN